jgi:alpha-D-xyloside xylohydrolase
MGAPVLSMDEKQAIAEVRIYPGANGEFTLYSDDGKSYAYEQGKSEITHLRWDDTSGRLEHTGAVAWSAPDTQIVKVVH